MAITRAYIHQYGHGKMEPEHRDVADVLQSRGIPFELFTTKKVLRNRLNPDPHTFVAGDHTVMKAVLKKLGFEPSTDPYPQSLRKYLDRNVWTSTIRELLTGDRHKSVSEIFVKPRSQTKLFTGFVIRTDFDLLQLQHYSKSTQLYCAQTATWVSEHRVFVINGKIAGIRNYTGNKEITLDMKIVNNAIGDFENSAEKTAGYGIDFGVLANGQTSLVEWNDGFSLGSYGLDKELYTDLLLARWHEIQEKTYAGKRSAPAQ